MDLDFFNCNIVLAAHFVADGVVIDTVNSYLESVKFSKYLQSRSV